MSPNWTEDDLAAYQERRARNAMPAGGAVGVGKARETPRATTGRPAPTEEQVQAAIVDALRLHGYLVETTVRRRKRCRECGAYSAGGDGMSRRVGDLLVRGSKWPTGLYLNADVKASGGRLQPDQQEAVLDCALVIWRDHETALSDVRRAEMDLGLRKWEPPDSGNAR